MQRIASGLGFVLCLVSGIHGYAPHPSYYQGHIKHTLYGGVGAGFQSFNHHGALGIAGGPFAAPLEMAVVKPGGSIFLGYRATYRSFLVGVEIDTLTPSVYKPKKMTDTYYALNAPTIRADWAYGGSLLFGYQLTDKGASLALRLGGAYRSFAYSPRIGDDQDGQISVQSRTGKRIFKGFAVVPGVVMTAPLGRRMEISADYRMYLSKKQTVGTMPNVPATSGLNTASIRLKTTVQVFMVRVSYKFLG